MRAIIDVAIEASFHERIQSSPSFGMSAAQCSDCSDALIDAQRPDERTDVVQRMTREFKLEGFELVIDEAVLDHIVADALRRETGARGLASTLTRHLEDVAFGAFGIDKGGHVRVVMRDDEIAVDVT